MKLCQFFKSLRKQFLSKNLIELRSSFLHSKSFCQSFGELAKCHQSIPYGQCDVSKYLVYNHILKSIVKELNEKVAKIVFFVTWINLRSHSVCHPDPLLKLLFHKKRSGFSSATEPFTLNVTIVKCLFTMYFIVLILTEWFGFP